jgi:hypothetical protein
MLVNTKSVYSLTEHLISSMFLSNSDRSHNIMILGHVILQHTIPCSGATQMHNWCATQMFAYVVSNMTSLFSSLQKKMLLFVFNCMYQAVSW